MAIVEKVGRDVPELKTDAFLTQDPLNHLHARSMSDKAVQKRACSGHNSKRVLRQTHWTAASVRVSALMQEHAVEHRDSACKLGALQRGKEV